LELKDGIRDHMVREEVPMRVYGIDLNAWLVR
jgi:hypothetical protein